MGKITLKIHPRAKKNEITTDGEVINVYITAPPIDGKANRALIDLLSEYLEVSKSALFIVRGERAHLKVIEVAGKETEDIIKILSKNRKKT